MTRPLRLQFPDALYHVISRGNLGSDIFLDDRDRHVFLIKLDLALEKYSATCFAYCLMSNHFHLFLRTDRANLSTIMHQLNSSYANWYRTKHKTVGAIFQDRYKSILVERDAYANELSAYIHLNPVRAGIVQNPMESRWSSYRIYHGLMKSPLIRLDPVFILQYFGATPRTAIKAYHEFVMDHIRMKNPMDEMPAELQGRVLGDSQFREAFKAKAREVGRMREISETRAEDGTERLSECDGILRRLSAEFDVAEVELLRKRKDNVFRKLLIYILKKRSSCSLRQIGSFVGMDYAAVSIASRRFEKQMEARPELASMAQRAESVIT
jgi:putative transposase